MCRLPMESQLPTCQCRRLGVDVKAVGADENQGHHEAGDNRADGQERAHVAVFNVNSVMAAAENSGRNSISQGKISYFIG